MVGSLAYPLNYPLSRPIRSVICERHMTKSYLLLVALTAAATLAGGCASSDCVEACENRFELGCSKIDQCDDMCELREIQGLHVDGPPFLCEASAKSCMALDQCGMPTNGPEN